MNASCALLACLEPSDRKLDLSGKNLTLKHVRGEVGEVVVAHLVEWDDGESVVLRHQHECSIHGLRPRKMMKPAA